MKLSDFNSVQTILTETESNTIDAHEVEFTIGLKCTAASFGGSFGPDGGDPPYGPEFELASIHFPVPPVKKKQDSGRSAHMETYTYMELTYPQFVGLVGHDTAEKLIGWAMTDAEVTGGF